MISIAPKLFVLRINKTANVRGVPKVGLIAIVGIGTPDVRKDVPE